MGLLLDSTIIIDHFNGIKMATDFIIQHQTQIFLSVITRAESLTGSDEHTIASATKFLNFFTTLPITVHEADIAATLRRTEKWKLPDALQAAIAKSHKLKFVTRNSEDFSINKYKFVMIPY